MATAYAAQQGNHSAETLRKVGSEEELTLLRIDRAAQASPLSDIFFKSPLPFVIREVS